VSVLRKLVPWLIAIAAVAGAILLILHFSSSEPDMSQRRGPGGPGGGGFGMSVTVSVEPVTRGSIDLLDNALGTVTAFNTVEVRPRVEGTLTEVRFEEGQAVSKGDVLAIVDPRPYQVALNQAKGALAQTEAQLANARVDLKRYEDLLAQTSIAEQEVQTQRALVRQYEGSVAADKATVDDAALNLEYTRIVAPIDGRVGLRGVDVGNLVSSGDTNPIVTITQTQPIAVRFSLPEQNLPALLPPLRSGVNIAVTALDRNQSQVLAVGRLDSVDNAIDTTTGTVAFKARFANEDEVLFPNQFVNVRLIAQTLDDVVVMPEAAVQHGNEGDYVYTVDADNVAHLQKVTLGVTQSERVVVEAGLDAGQRVVTEGADNLRDGATVTVSEAGPPEIQELPQRPRRGPDGPGGPAGPGRPSADAGPPGAPPAGDGASGEQPSGKPPAGGESTPSNPLNPSSDTSRPTP